MSPSWIWSDKITNERVVWVGYNHFISNKGEWNNCFSKFSNRALPPIFISTIFQSGKFLNLAHYFPYDVKLRLLAHSRSFLANQKARNAIVGAGNLLKWYIRLDQSNIHWLASNWNMSHLIDLDVAFYMQLISQFGLTDTMMFQLLWTSHSPVARYETCIRSNRTSRADRIETRLIFGEHVVISNFLSD